MHREAHTVRITHVRMSVGLLLRSLMYLEARTLPGTPHVHVLPYQQGPSPLHRTRLDERDSSDVSSLLTGGQLHGVSFPPLFLFLRLNLKDQGRGEGKKWSRSIPYSPILNSRTSWGRKSIEVGHAFLFTVGYLSHWSSLWYKKWLAV